MRQLRAIIAFCAVLAIICPAASQEPEYYAYDMPVEGSENPDISVDCEVGDVSINNAIAQLFYPSVSGSIKKLSIWMKPTSYVTKYRVRIYHSLIPGRGLIASSNIFTLGTLQTGTQAKFYDFQFPSSVNLNQADGYIWKLERLSRYSGTFAPCPNTIPGHGIWQADPQYPEPDKDYSFKLYIMKSTPDIAACQHDNPCQNGATCTDDGLGGYSCMCAAGYTGPNCQTNINDCNPNPCHNGGSCTDGVNSFTCRCAAGYTGTICQFGCINHLKIDALTGDRYFAGHDEQYGSNEVKLVLKNGEIHQAQIPGNMSANTQYLQEIFVGSLSGNCFRHGDIQEVHLLGTSSDGWYIASVNTYTKTDSEGYKLLSSDPNFEKWVDKDQEQEYQYNAKDLQLTLKIQRDIVDCGYGKPSCECRRYADECEFDLEVDEIRTFTSYQKLPSGEGMEVRGVEGTVFYLGDDGSPHATNSDSPCSMFGNPNCSDPLFVDGKTYRLAIAVNGQIPAPTIIVHEDQTVILNVKNNLTTEGISIHWHGMHQMGTPWMDGVGQVTQCQIGPSSTFQYKYLARPSGTFWYHSHSGAQRTDGFYGALIVRESTTRLDHIRNILPLPPMLRDFKDQPGEHTLSLLDWQQESSLDLFTQLTAGLGFHPDNPIGEVPTDSYSYNATFTYDGTRVGPLPYYSGLINGKGSHKDIPYHKTRLSVFYVERGNVYRFRLIGAQGLYQYKFSIDEHKLILIGTDGYWTLPERQVDYIIIHTGERYDFLLEANAPYPKHDFWIRAETMETNNEGNPPYNSLGNVAEAILHYRKTDDTGNPDADVLSTQYEDIKKNSLPITCTSSESCKAVNCPFRNFHSSYNIHCTNVEELKLLEATTNDQLPMATPDEDCSNCIHFFNFHFEGASATASINGRNFILPSFPPQTQHQDFLDHDTICNISTNCNPSTIDCLCTHVSTIPYDKTIQFVWSAMGSSSHPIHLHGHTFHIVHVGYPEYDENAEVETQNSDIHCEDINCNNEDCDPKRCTQPSWNGSPPPLTITPRTIRKDTVVIPGSGYVVINFISDNPGYWFMHCHKETHQLEGMAAIINEAFKFQGEPPQGMNTCGDFTPWKSYN